MVGRSAWVLGSTVSQLAIVAAFASVSSALATRVAGGALVPVKLVRPSATAPPPQPPRVAAGSRPRAQTHRRAQQEIVQPREVPQDLAPPAPPPEVEEEGEVEDEGDEGGIAGGVAGGVVGGVADGGPRAPPRPWPLKFNSSMTAPRLLFAPLLEYTQRALDREVEGTMLVECIVSVDGAVRHCRVLKSLPLMDRAVVENLERRRYEPATLGGKPLDVAYTFTIRLKLPE